MHMLQPVIAVQGRAHVRTMHEVVVVPPSPRMALAASACDAQVVQTYHERPELCDYWYHSLRYLDLRGRDEAGPRRHRRRRVSGVPPAMNYDRPRAIFTPILATISIVLANNRQAYENDQFSRSARS